MRRLAITTLSIATVGSALVLVLAPSGGAVRAHAQVIRMRAVTRVAPLAARHVLKLPAGMPGALRVQLQRLARRLPPGTSRPNASVSNAPRATVPPESGTTCYAAGGCSIHPCDEWASSSTAAVYAVPSAVVVTPRAGSSTQPRSRCRTIAGPSVSSRVSTATAMPAASPTGLDQTSVAVTR